MLFRQQTVRTLWDDHVNPFSKVISGKHGAFRFESLCLPITDIGKHVFVLKPDFVLGG
jgi:hypothetical protein